MKTLSYVLMVLALVFLGFTIGRAFEMSNQKEPTNIEVREYGDTRFELREYTGVGSGVFKHGTIVQVVNGQPKVVGNFIDESGEFSPGTVEIVSVK